MNNIDYIKFVVSKVESDFLEYSNSREYVKVITVLNSLKMADNILRELYILSGIKKLRRLTSYFIFMIKKVEAGSITLDNFMENYITDKNYIDSYFQTYYDLEQITPEEFNTEEIDTTFIIEEDEVPTEAPVYLLAESTFKVEELDNELVTEEFRESTINENYESPGDGYLKLAEEFTDNISDESNEVFFDDNEDVFSLPKSETSLDNNDIITDPLKNTGVLPDQGNKDIITDSINNTVVLPEEAFFTGMDEAADTIDEKQEVLFEETSKEKVPVGNDDLKNENLADFFEKLDNEDVTEDNAEEKVVFIETQLSNDDNLGVPGEENIYVENIIEKEDTEEEIENKVLQDLIPVVPSENDFAVEEEEVGIETDSEIEEKLHEIEQGTKEELLNAEFIKYEKSLYEKNKQIIGLLDDLILISESKDPDIEMRDAIVQEVFPLVEYLKEESEKMSFEIISGIYGSFMFCLDIKFKDIVVTKENIEVFKLSVTGVENLVRGDELKDLDKTIKDLEGLQGDLNKLLADREDFQKKKYDFGEEESNLIKEFKDSSEYDAYIILRDKITELEDTFQIIAGMKDKTYPFESLRKLSVTFALFREIVNIARVLEMNKVAHLAEAGYVFVKFVQNYRIDPFKDEVTEVFKYLIYSFKLIYLDKPVKDFDTFVSFLNDPVKIFYQKNKSR
ncbi:MAG: hypothetical protein ACOYN6_10035 [Ignavibacteria bacterium]